MESTDGDLSGADRRRRSRLLFRHSKIPVRMLVPNFFTLVSLCAGITAIRMAIEQRFEIAVLLVVAAALLDGIDGRIARALKAQSKFGAELDSLADFVNFGVAPALIVYTWGLGSLRGFGWIAALVFACCMGLRLARFNAMSDVEKPKWQSNYFTGVPAPAGAIVVLLPFYLAALDLTDLRSVPVAVAIYTLLIAALLVSTLPTFSGKLLGERIRHEWVLPIFAAVALLFGLFVTYPFAVLLALVLFYLALMPFSYQRFREHTARDKAAVAAPAGSAVSGDRSSPEPVVGATQKRLAAAPDAPSTDTKH